MTSRLALIRILTAFAVVGNAQTFTWLSKFYPISGAVGWLRLNLKPFCLLVLGAATGTANAAVILDHGLSENAQGRRAFSSTYEVNASEFGGNVLWGYRSGDQFELTTPTNLTSVSVCGYMDNFPGFQERIDLVTEWKVALFGWNGTSFTTDPIVSKTFATPSNPDFIEDKGLGWDGNILHNVNFQLDGSSEFSSVAPGTYLISVIAGVTGMDVENGHIAISGVFRHSSSNEGNPLTNYVRRNYDVGWRQTLTELGPDFTPGTIRLEGAPVPEPATTAAFGIGIVTLLKRRRNHFATHSGAAGATQ